MSTPASPETDGPRELFCVPESTYLLSHSVGLLPQVTRSWAESHLLETWATTPSEAWPSWLVEIDGFRAALGKLFNHQPAWFCPQTNVSAAATKVLHALPARIDKPTILLSEDAFPSLGFVAEKAAALGFKVKLTERSLDPQDLDVWAQHMTPDVGVVIVTHVHSNTGELIPIKPIVDMARERDTWSIVDVAQSAGVIPIDLEVTTPDFMVGSTVKWLCGGPGAGFLWANPDVVPLCEPTDVGWFSHEDPFEFDIGQFRYANDARRFWGGTPNVASFAIARRSIELLTNIGITNIRDHNLALTTALLDAIDAIDPAMVVSPNEPERRSGTAVLSAEARGDQLDRAFMEANIQVDRRAVGFRVSPHIYNTLEDIEQIASAVRTLI